MGGGTRRSLLRGWTGRSRPGWEAVMVIADVFDNLGGHNITGLVTVTLIFGGWIVVAVVSSVAKNWRKVHESEHLAALKQSMIERGMSADEIERVLRAA